LDWSPDGRRVASASLDGTVRVLDPSAGEELLCFYTPAGTVTQLRWSPDGLRLAAAANGKILIWDASPGYAYLKSKQYLWEQARGLHLKASELEKDGKWTEAHAARTELREKLMIAVGPDHPETLTVTKKMAVDLIQHGRPSDAIPLLEQAVEKEKAFRHSDNPSLLEVLRNLAHAYEAVGRYEAAEPLWRDIVNGFRRVEDPKSSEFALNLATYATNLLKQKKFAEVEPILRECLQIREEKIPNDWPRFNTMNQLGGALLGQRKYAEAEPLLIQGYEGMKQREDTIPSNGKIRLQEAIERIVQLYEATGRPELAREWRAKLEPGAPAP
jgi:tetratricopeptide (TPR) repeat protein